MAKQGTLHKLAVMTLVKLALFWLATESMCAYVHACTEGLGFVLLIIESLFNGVVTGRGESGRRHLKAKAPGLCLHGERGLQPSSTAIGCTRVELLFCRELCWAT